MCAMRSPRGERCKPGYCHLSRVTILLLLIATVAEPHSTRVSTRFGLVQGLWNRTVRGRPVAHYLGIPYAEPPLGDLRFRHPTHFDSCDDTEQFSRKMCAMRSPRGERCRPGCCHLSRVTILLLLIAAVAEPHSTRVSTRFGLVQGLWNRTVRGRPVAHYLGIPYAEPPVGDLRFRSPQPWSRTWNDTYFATENPPPCTQPTDNGDVTGSEDCLHLSIFVPKVSEKWEENPKLPVMVYVHGGKSTIGHINSYIYGPYYLLDQNVILVTIQYRLNLFGFFSMGNKVCPGNYGLKDTLVALRWVHENIESFRGDPNSVTLFGHSSGAAVVHAMALTNKTEGLFNRYIMQSGCTLQKMYNYSKRKMRKRSLEAASILGCLPRRIENVTESVTDSFFKENSTLQLKEATERKSQGVVEEEGYNEEEDEEIMRCMRTIEAEKIVRVLPHYVIWNRHPCCMFAPTVEENSDDAILTMHPLTIIKKRLFRDIPYITGVVDQEGLSTTGEFIINPVKEDELRNNLDDHLLLLLEHHDRFTNSSAFIGAVEDFYFDGNITENLMRNLTDLVSDGVYVWPQYQTLKYQSEGMNSSNYFYLFSYYGTFSDSIKYGTRVHLGATHSDDLYYLFPYSRVELEDWMLHNTENDITMINIMTELWANFAIKGVPEAWNVPTWPEYKNSNEYLQLGMGNNPEISVKRIFLPERMAFWEEVVSNLYTDDTDPESIVNVSTEEEESSASVCNKYDILFCSLIISIVYLL